MGPRTERVALAIIALIGTIFSGYVALKQVPDMAKKVEVVETKVETVGTTVKGVTNDIKTLEENTNSIKDELVRRTAEASEAKGKSKEQAAQAGRDAEELKRRRATDKQILDNALKLKKGEPK